MYRVYCQSIFALTCHNIHCTYRALHIYSQFLLAYKALKNAKYGFSHTLYIRDTVVLLMLM